MTALIYQIVRFLTLSFFFPLSALSSPRILDNALSKPYLSLFNFVPLSRPLSRIARFLALSPFSLSALSSPHFKHFQKD
jgi:hypothetical protein